MKILRIMVICLLVAGSAQAQLADGVYFIVNAHNNQAITPFGATPGQNVFLNPFNKSGMQKWVVKQLIDKQTGKPNGRYTIRFSGETDGLYLAPFPAADHTSMLGEYNEYRIIAEDDTYMIKSMARNGDALFVFQESPGMLDVRIGTDEGSEKYRWTFEKAEN